MSALRKSGHLPSSAVQIFSVGPIGDILNERARQLLNTEATLLSFRLRDVRKALKLVP